MTDVPDIGQHELELRSLQNHQRITTTDHGVTMQWPGTKQCPENRSGDRYMLHRSLPLSYSYTHDVPDHY